MRGWSGCRTLVKRRFTQPERLWQRQVYDYYITVDVEGVGEELLSIPLRADCQVIRTPNLISSDSNERTSPGGGELSSALSGSVGDKAPENSKTCS